MVSRTALILLGLALAGHAIAADQTRPMAPAELCRQSTALVRQAWLNGLIDAPEPVARLMVDATDGQLQEARNELAAMAPADGERWRQSALMAATWADQTAVVEGLLADGADVDGKGWQPPYRRAFFDATVESMKHDPRFGGAKAVAGLQTSGLIADRGSYMGPPLAIATRCDDAGLVKVLLRHHADARAPHPVGNTTDPLLIAVLHGNATITRMLLDHGANVCADDRRMHARQGQIEKRYPNRKPFPLKSVADIGRHAHLGADLIARLSCPGFDPPH